MGARNRFCQPSTTDTCQRQVLTENVNDKVFHERNLQKLRQKGENHSRQNHYSNNDSRPCEEAPSLLGKEGEDHHERGHSNGSRAIDRMRHSERHQPQRCSTENNALAARAPTVKFGVGEARQQDEVITRRELVPSKVVEQGSVGYADFRYEYDRQNAVDGSHPKEHADEGINSAPPAACGDQKSEGVKAYGIEQRIDAVGKVDGSRHVSRDARGRDREAKED